MGVGHVTLTTTYAETRPNRFRKWTKIIQKSQCQTAPFWGCFIPPTCLKVVVAHCSLLMLTMGIYGLYHGLPWFTTLPTSMVSALPAGRRERPRAEALGKSPRRWGGKSPGDSVHSKNQWLLQPFFCEQTKTKQGKHMRKFCLCASWPSQFTRYLEALRAII